MKKKGNQKAEEYKGKQRRTKGKKRGTRKKEISFFTVKINELTVIKDYFAGLQRVCLSGVN